MNRRKFSQGLALVSLTGAHAPAACSQLEEVFSKHIRIHRPVGAFAQRLIRVAPGGEGNWTRIDDFRKDYRLALPDGVQADRKEEGSRILHAFLSSEPRPPRPSLRLDSFKPQAGEQSSIDLEYAQQLAEQYPQAFGNKFVVTDSGMLEFPHRSRMAMVGGTYLQGAARAYRLYCSYLSKERQLFFTFDCAEDDWSRYQDLVASILLSLEVPRRRK